MSIAMSVAKGFWIWVSDRFGYTSAAQTARCNRCVINGVMGGANPVLRQRYCSNGNAGGS